MSILKTNTFLNQQLKLIFDATENNDPTLPEHQYNLGMAYKEGKHELKKNFELAFKWFEKAANNRHIQAQFELAKAYEGGTGIEDDRLLSIQWYRKAAYASGNALAYGIGVEQDCYRATQWYEEAATRGHEEAQFALANAYMLDDAGVERNYFLAAKWYKAASDQGHKQAGFELEKMYLRGLVKRPAVSDRHPITPCFHALSSENTEKNSNGDHANKHRVNKTCVTRECP